MRFRDARWRSLLNHRASVSKPVTPHWYAEAFALVQEQLRAGNTYEVNLTYRDDVGRADDPLATYLRLRATNPAPYAGLLRHRGTHLLSSSPERYATIDRRRWLETKPIKGTTPRGATAEDDERLRESLATDPKYRAENLMIVDLLRNDLSMVCEVGTVAVPSLMAVESYATVHQLVSTVRGRLRDDVTTVGALRALFPAGSMTGAPKLRTMEIIDEVEETPRGLYAGAFGWICADGRADLGVVIRSLYAGPDGVWRVGTGGGITVRSDVDEEWAETLWKAERLRAAPASSREPGSLDKVEARAGCLPSHQAPRMAQQPAPRVLGDHAPTTGTPTMSSPRVRKSGLDRSLPSGRVVVLVRAQVGGHRVLLSTAQVGDLDLFTRSVATDRRDE